jgi:hypothetical protein
MRPTIPTILLTGVLAVWLPSVNAQNACPPYRPCGAGETWGGNRLVKQGFLGADFRPSCQAHDTCEGTPRDCDRQFLQNMYTACDSSTDPRKCRKKARNYFLASRIYHTIIPMPVRRLFQRR